VTSQILQTAFYLLVILACIKYLRT